MPKVSKLIIITFLRKPSFIVAIFITNYCIILLRRYLIYAYYHLHNRCRNQKLVKGLLAIKLLWFYLNFIKTTVLPVQWFDEERTLKQKYWVIVGFLRPARIVSATKMLGGEIKPISKMTSIPAFLQASLEKRGASFVFLI